MKNFVDWLVSEDSWKGLAAITYLVICLFDFVIMPIYLSITTPSVLELMSFIGQTPSEVSIQALQLLSQSHQPFTLQGGGLFHIAFGAILTGTILKDKASKEN